MTQQVVRNQTWLQLQKEHVSLSTPLSLALSLSLYKLTCIWLRNYPAFYRTQCSLPPTQQPTINPLNAELNPICHLLALLEDHHIFHVSGLRVKHSPKHKSEIRVVFRKNILCCEKYSGLPLVDHQYLKAMSHNSKALWSQATSSILMEPCVKYIGLRSDKRRGQ